MKTTPEPNWLIRQIQNLRCLIWGYRCTQDRKKATACAPKPNSRIFTKKKYKSGQRATVSGQYEIVRKDGTRTGKERTVVKGEPFPPTPGRGLAYVLVDRTKTGTNEDQ